MREVVVSAPGKIILTGEHAVVHGEPCVAAATELRLHCRAVVPHASQNDDAVVCLQIVQEGLRAFVDPVENFGDLGVKITQGANGVCVQWDAKLFCAALEEMRKTVVLQELRDCRTQRTARMATTKRLHPIARALFHGTQDSNNTITPLNPAVQLSSEVFVVVLFLALLQLPSDDDAGTATLSDFCALVRSQGLNVTIASTLPMGRGMGSSAAFCVALSTAFHCLKDQQNEVSDAMRKSVDVEAGTAEFLIHGNPSGVDTAVSCYGGMVLLQIHKTIGPRLAHLPLHPDQALNGIVVDSGVERQTHKLVSHVGELVKERPRLYNTILHCMGSISEGLVKTLKQTNHTTNTDENTVHRYHHVVEYLESRMELAHVLLCAVGVGHPTLDRIREISIANGCRGCKLTGAGGGGCAVIVPPVTLGAHTVNTEKLTMELQKEGFVVHNTKLGVQGVRVDDAAITWEDRFNFVLV